MKSKAVNDLSEAIHAGRVSLGEDISISVLKPDRLPIVDQSMELARLMKEFGVNTPAQIGGVLRVAAIAVEQYGMPVYKMEKKS